MESKAFQCICQKRIVERGALKSVGLVGGQFCLQVFFDIPVGKWGGMFGSAAHFVSVSGMGRFSWRSMQIRRFRLPFWTKLRTLFQSNPVIVSISL